MTKHVQGKQSEDIEADIGEEADAAHSADSLVKETYPSSLRRRQVEYLKVLFKDVPDKGPERLAEQLLLCLKLPSYPLSKAEVMEFLLHISTHGKDAAARERALVTFSLFTDWVGEPSAKRRKITPTSGYEWTGAELDFFAVVFEVGFDIPHIIPEKPLSARCQAFLDDHMNITTEFIYLDSEDPSDFLEYMKMVYLKKGNESAVDDLMCEFLKRVMSPRFLISTRYRMKLKMALRNLDQDPPSEATADIIVMRKKIRNKPRMIGLLVVEDKSFKNMNLDSPTKAAEAQLFAQGVAVAQQENWNLDVPVYMLRVIGLQVTIYKARFDRNFLRDVELGRQRLLPFKVQKLVPAPWEDEEVGLRGFDLSKPEERRVVASVLNSISIDIVGEV